MRDEVDDADMCVRWSSGESHGGRRESEDTGQRVSELCPLRCSLRPNADQLAVEESSRTKLVDG